MKTQKDFTERNEQHAMRIFNILYDLGCNPVSSGGSQIRALCPFHDDHRPSFSLKADDGAWYCHACGDSGVIWQFLGLCAAHELSVDTTTDGERVFGRVERQKIKRAQQRKHDFPVLEVDLEKVRQCHYKIIQHWHRCLHENPKAIRLVCGHVEEQFIHLGFDRKGKKERPSKEHTYISPRFTMETILEFRIGFAPRSNAAFIKRLLEQYDKNTIVATGLFYVGGNHGLHASFAGRIVYPYLSSGQSVYATARLTPLTGNDRSDNKYLKQRCWHGDWKLPLDNPPLFNMEAIKPHKAILLTEGITDAIKACEAGVPAVSPVTLHVALRHMEEVATMLCQTTVILCYDNEENGAGKNGMEKMLERLKEKGVEVLCVTLPRSADQEKVDVCSFILRNGGAAFHEQIEMQTGISFRPNPTKTTIALNAYMQGEDLQLRPEDMLRAVQLVFNS